MKINLKNLLKNKIFIGCSAAVLVGIITITTILLLPDKKPNDTPPVATESSDVNANVPKITEPPTSEEESNTAEEKTPSDLAVDVGGDTQKQNDKDKEPPAKEPEKPITTKEPEQPKQPDEGNGGGGINADGGGKPEKYNCGAANHHCENADAHAWICNLELDGCEMCGSHSCASIYAVDQWGGASPNIKKCPKYSEKNDPVEYCQKCKKKNGDGDNDTCQKWIIDFTCPKCGQLVKANECHTH